MTCQRVITLFLQTLAFYYVDDVKIHTSEHLKDLGSHFLKTAFGPSVWIQIHINIDFTKFGATAFIISFFCDSGFVLIWYTSLPRTILLSQLRGSYCFYVCIIVTRHSQSSTIAPFQGIQDSLGFSIPSRGLWIPGAEFSLSVDSGFHALVGFWSTWALVWIPKPWIPDTTSKIFPDFGFYKQEFPRF